MELTFAHFGSSLGAAVAGIVTIMVVGGVMPIWLPRESRHLPHALSAAAGVMLATALFHLLPEATEVLGEGAGYAALAGFVFLYLFERFVTVHICEAKGCEVHTVGLSALFGLSVHTFVNGVALGAGLLEGVGTLVFIAIASHKLPEAFSLTAILLHEKYSRAQVFWMNVLFIAMIPLGAWAVRLVTLQSESAVAPYALAFSAGTFLHIAVSDLLPEVHQSSAHRLGSILSFVGGIVAVALLGGLMH